MKRQAILTHEFVQLIPEELKEGVIYVCVQYATVAHKCCCGCGREVVTPLSPTDWKLIFDGSTVTLEPSIGNWSFECQSHYWIRSNRVSWGRKWSRKMIDAGRAHDRSVKERYYSGTDLIAEDAVAKGARATETRKKPSIWQKFKHWWEDL